MKLGISIKINVTKIDKARLFAGAKGNYLDLTTFIDVDNQGEYGDNGFISQSVSKEEKANGIQTPILGNCTVFYNDTKPNDAPANNAPQQQAPQQAPQPHTPTPNGSGGFDSFDEDIPF